MFLNAMAPFVILAFTITVCLCTSSCTLADAFQTEKICSQSFLQTLCPGHSLKLNFRVTCSQNVLNGVGGKIQEINKRAKSGQRLGF